MKVGRTIAVTLLLAMWGFVLLLALHTSRSPEHFGKYSSEYLTFLIAVTTAVGACTIVALSGRIRRGLLATRGWIIVPLSLLFSIAIAEVLVRWTDFLGASMYQEVSRYMLDLDPDPDLEFVHQPSIERRYSGAEVVINNMGFRDRPLGEKDSERLRVLLLGDSVTFGWGVDVEETFGRRLEPLLSSRLGKPVDTINTGVCGYNTEQELATLQRFAPSLEPDVVVLLYVENDVDLVGPVSPRELATMPSPIEQPDQALHAVLGKSYLYRIAYHLAPIFFPVLREANEGDTEKGEGWRRSMAALREVARYCRARQIPFATFLFRLEANEKNARLDARIAAVAEEESFVYADVLPWFNSVSTREITNSFLDIHPNVQGHAILARGIAEVLAKHPEVLER